MLHLEVHNQLVMDQSLRLLLAKANSLLMSPIVLTPLRIQGMFSINM